MFEMKERTRKINAYTLAEMLIVMAIIMLIILSLPAATKKVFKIDEMRKSHGRYECYWEVQDDGTKKLKSYMAEENGRQVVTEYTEADNGICKFTPPSNPIYFMIHAVGGGGAGAQIETSKSALEDPEFTSAINYLYKSSPDLHPDWVDYVNSLSSSKIPWYGKDSYDVSKSSSQQTIRYRLGGTAAKVVSLFVPQLTGNVKLELQPGKGGAVTNQGDGSGGDGENTIVRFIYPATNGGADKSYEAILAKGGKGGNGSIDGRTSVMLIGGKPGDFGLSNYASIKSKTSGFSDITESAEKYDELKTKISYDAGAGGSGETQYVSSTAGFVLYEYDNNGGIKDNQRINSNWQNITTNVGLNLYRNLNLTHNCQQKSRSNIELSRSGYCTNIEYNPPNLKFDCTVGKTSDTKNKTCTGSPCSHFVVSYNQTTGNSTFNPNPTSYSSSKPFYNCEFDYNYSTITCKTKLSNMTVHDCTTPSGTNKCSNGATPVGSGKNKKCPAGAGGDGAVVILW